MSSPVIPPPASSPIAQFRSDFPEFADTTKYTDGMVSFWTSFSMSLVNGVRWAELTGMGIELCTAHHLIIAVKNQGAASAGGQTGQVTGPITSKGVDRVSVSYDIGSVLLTDAGFWNMTTYGIRFLQLARLMGSGPVQL